MDEVIQLTRDMVATASVNPQDSDDTNPPYGEQRMVELVGGWLGEAGLRAEILESRPGRESVLVTAEGKDSGKTVLLSAHMDTVEVKGMSIEPFDPQVREGRIYGRGACDDKGPLATLMVAYRDRVRQGNLPCNLALLATCGEEHDMAGARYYAERSAGKVTAAIFAEPTELNVVVAHKGVVRMRMCSKGKNAHSSTPELGTNAIYPMARAVTAVEEFARQLKTRSEHPRLGHETLSVTIVEGGQQVNIIPENCRAEIDWRILPGRDPKQCLEELREAVLAQAGSELSAEIMNQYESMETDEKQPFVRALCEAVKYVNSSMKMVAVPYVTDASAFVEHQIPTVIFGPGSPAQAHTQDEYVEIEQLKKGLAAYKGFLEGDWGIG